MYRLQLQYKMEPELYDRLYNLCCSGIFASEFSKAEKDRLRRKGKSFLINQKRFAVSQGEEEASRFAGQCIESNCGCMS